MPPKKSGGGVLVAVKKPMTTTKKARRSVSFSDEVQVIAPPKKTTTVQRRRQAPQSLEKTLISLGKKTAQYAAIAALIVSLLVIVFVSTSSLLIYFVHKSPRWLLIALFHTLNWYLQQVNGTITEAKRNPKDPNNPINGPINLECAIAVEGLGIPPPADWSLEVFHMILLLQLLRIAKSDKGHIIETVVSIINSFKPEAKKLEQMDVDLTNVKAQVDHAKRFGGISVENLSQRITEQKAKLEELYQSWRDAYCLTADEFMRQIEATERALAEAQRDLDRVAALQSLPPLPDSRSNSASGDQALPPLPDSARMSVDSRNNSASGDQALPPLPDSDSDSEDEDLRKRVARLSAHSQTTDLLRNATFSVKKATKHVEAAQQLSDKSSRKKENDNAAPISTEKLSSANQSLIKSAIEQTKRVLASSPHASAISSSLSSSLSSSSSSSSTTSTSSTMQQIVDNVASKVQSTSTKLQAGAKRFLDGVDDNQSSVDKYYRTSDSDVDDNNTTTTVELVRAKRLLDDDSVTQARKYSNKSYASDSQ